MSPVDERKDEQDQLSADELREVWAALAGDERLEGFLLLPREDAEDLFLSLTPLEQAQLVTSVPAGQRRIWMRQLAPDDAADVLQEIEPSLREDLAGLLDDATRREVRALMAYAEDDAGGLMSPRFARVRPDMQVDEAIRYLQKQARDRLETIYYAYVLDSDQRLLGVCSFRELFASIAGRLVRDIMHDDPVTVREDMDQEAVALCIKRHGFLALPVVDADGRMKGIVTLDDIVDVVEEEATEDVQKFGGMEALEAPYMQTSFGSMIQKRGGWLALLFVGEMLTATAMARYEHDIARAVVLAVFVPLIISSGGNSGSQASTLIIRAMALGEVRLRDWWRIVQRELAAGLVLGMLLAVLGALRIVGWEAVFHSYGVHYPHLALTVGISLIGVVTMGTLCGSMLPLLLKRVGLDPASASAPFVATLVDVSGLLIYFTAAKLVMGGKLL
ncbi:MAG: magnesium transporter [Deltaproteobacteria bacterium]|nr:magnesium transporter [Deltaproteobacteria bacterium]